MASIWIIKSRINEGPSGVAVELWEVLAEIGQVKKLIDAAKEMILWNVIFKIEGVEKSILAITLKPHHSKAHSLF